MITIYKTITFDSAHILEGHPKCGKLHGHTYKIEMWITGEPAGDYGFVIDFKEIKDYFNKYDHSGVVLNISAEKMASESADYFLNKFSNIKQVKARVWETPTAYAEAEYGRTRN